MQTHPKPVENYTNTCLVLFCVLIFMALMTIWAAFGYFASIITGFFAHLAMRRLPRTAHPAKTCVAASMAPDP